MPMNFTKMHGLGNDFVVIDAINQSVSLTPENIRNLADRHFGIGFDQMLLVEPVPDSSADFRYRIFNADGSEVAQCGNGARCFARFVREKGLSMADEIRVQTNAGLLVLHHENDGHIMVNMGVPRLLSTEVPLTLTPESDGLYSLMIDGNVQRFAAVSMGNPHAVLRVLDTVKTPVATLGQILESHPVFPQRANIGFMQIDDEHHIQLRVYERGSGETLACGSGACAAAVCGISQGWLASPVHVALPGGGLLVRWAGQGLPVFMSGPAATVFEGSISL